MNVLQGEDPGGGEAARVKTGIEKIVLVTRKTRLEELIERFNTFGQAKFYIEHAGGNFTDYVHEHDAYRTSLDIVQKGFLQSGLKTLKIGREIVPTYLFTKEDLVVTLGQDGLVANCAKYIGDQLLIGANPDPARFDGVLLPFTPQQVSTAIAEVLENRARVQPVTLAEVVMDDGQRLLAFNDVFIGARTHISARYNITTRGRTEAQSSSGIIVSTGAGSTGWLSSTFNMAAGLARFLGRKALPGKMMDWENPDLLFVVREPFISRHSKADLVAGYVSAKEGLQIESLMSAQGVIFSDGMEADYLEFNAGRTATIRPARQKAHLVTRKTPEPVV